MVESRDKKLTDAFSRYDRNRYLYSYLCIAAYLLINNSINASSVWMEHSRDGTPSIEVWEPFAWEYSSALSTLILLPFIFSIFRRFPLRFDNLGKQLCIHIIATLFFSAAHVTMMVVMREGVYSVAGGDYNFGPLLNEFWYEYRKDAWGYLIWLVAYQIFHVVYKRLKGEASIVDDDENAKSSSNEIVSPDFLLVKKLDKEFLVKVAEIEWLESSGNYVNLHKGGRIYPLRGTLAETVSKLSNAGFSRIHRSFGVNHSAIDSIQYQPSGDGIVTLKSGVELAVSRRYKAGFKQIFE